MLRRILIASVLGIGLVTALAVPAVADARPPYEVRRHEEFHHRDFEVLYRDARCGWKVYGHFHNRGEAARAAEQMRCRGFQVDIRPC
jgi:hypothetical protein